MNSCEKPCRHCKKTFLAEPDENAEYSSICFDCDLEIHRLVSQILSKKFGPPKKPQWFDEGIVK